jgi:DNA polymerase III alpha subunit
MKIKTVRSLGKQETFNLTMAAPYHNYCLANGLITANSHAVGYAHTTYQTAYLKANYPAEFFGALLSNTVDQDMKNSYIREAQNLGLKILPIDINKSTMRYEVENVQTIRRDLASLKGVGAKAVDDILEKRPFKNMVDFLSRTDSKKVTSRVIIALIKAGAFEGAFEGEKVSRKGYFDFFDDCRKKIKRYIKRLRDKSTKEGKPVPTLEECMKDFPGYDWHNPLNTRAQGRGKNRIEVGTPVLRASKDDRPEWSDSEIVTFEYEIYGASVTHNVFDFHCKAEEVFKSKCDPIYRFEESLDEYNHQDRIYMMINVKGLLRKSPYRKDKKKFTRRYLVEDRTGEGMLTVFDREWAANPNAWRNGNVLILQCSCNVFMNRKSVVVNRVLKNCGRIDGSM